MKFAVLTLLLLCPVAYGQGPSEWVGRKVVTKRPTPLTDGGRVVDRDAAFRVYTVRRVDGDRLFVEWGGAAGWVPADSVIPEEQAIDHYSREVAGDPRAWWALRRRGDALALRGEHARAIADFDEVIRLRPDLPDGYTGRGIVRTLVNEWDRAIADLDKALAIDACSAEALFFRGSAWLMKDEYDRAIADLDKAAATGFADARLHLARATAWFRRGDAEAAVADLNEAVRLRPEDATAYGVRAVVWQTRGQTDKALADSDTAIRLGIRDARIYVVRGNSRLIKHQIQPGLDDYLEAIRLDPNERRALSSLAWIWATSPDSKYRDGGRAVGAATRACELSGWKDASCIATLAAAYAESGDFAKAVEFQEKSNALFEDADDKAAGQERLRLYKSGKPYRDED
jgi:tetratricopeptide (TPR) repeat protein